LPGTTIGRLSQPDYGSMLRVQLHRDVQPLQRRRGLHRQRVGEFNPIGVSFVTNLYAQGKSVSFERLE
jgi:hypothetical protein